jgi:hypothetical protein
MSSSFAGLGLFNSGPHRFQEQTRGYLALPNSIVLGAPGIPGTIITGRLERTVLVTGRLVGSSESALWTVRDAITAAFTAAPGTPGLLIDHSGRQWTDMTFIHFGPWDRVDRGRAWSLRYEAKFVKVGDV